MEIFRPSSEISRQARTKSPLTLAAQSALLCPITIELPARGGMGTVEQVQTCRSNAATARPQSRQLRITVASFTALIGF